MAWLRIWQVFGMLTFSLALWEGSKLMELPRVCRPVLPCLQNMQCQ